MPRTFCGEALRRLRQARGLRPEPLAILVDRSASTIYHYENGVAVPPADTLGALAAALGCTVDALFTESERERSQPSARTRASSGRCEHCSNVQTQAAA